MMGIRFHVTGLSLAVALLFSAPGMGEDWTTVQWVRQLLSLGLADHAVAAFRGLPPAVRARLEEGPFETATGEIPDVRLELAAAHILAGDDRGAAALAGKLPALPAEPVPSLLVRKPGDVRPKNDRLLQGLIHLWLHPSSEDPFELLSESAGREGTAGMIFEMLLGKVADRESYPDVAKVSFRSVAFRVERWTGNPVPSLPERVITAGQRLKADGASLVQTLREQMRTAAEKASRGPIPETEIRARTAAEKVIEPFRRSDDRPSFMGGPYLDLFMIDRAGTRAFTIWYEGPPVGPQGGQIRLEESGGSWKAEVIGSWIA